MRPVQAYRRRSSASFWLGSLLVLMMAAGGIVGLLVLLGVNLNPFAGPQVDPFMVRIPINSRPIPAYTQVDRAHLLNPSTGGLMYQRIPPPAVVGMSLTGIADDGSHVEGRVEAVRNAAGHVVFVAADGREVRQDRTIELGGALMNANAIVGRVVKRDKRAGLGFREDTFFPQGTPVGIAGATPPGMRAVTLDANMLTGVHALNSGDRIDLMANVPASELGSFQSQYHSRGAALLTAVSGNNKAESATEPVLLAQNAVVIKPVYVRNEASTSASLTQGQRVQNVPKYEVALAVAPEDVIPLQSALNRRLAITCITHSMQAGGNETPLVVHHESETVVPVTVRPILAYDVVGRDAFVNPATRRVRMEPISRQQIDRLGIITSVDEALGAIARHDIPAGRFLRRADLLSGALQESPVSPPREDRRASARSDASMADGTTMVSLQQSDEPFSSAPTAVGDRPAITTFIPAGRRAIAVPWSSLYGAEHLQIDDRVDLVATYPLERRRQQRDTVRRADDSVVTSESDELLSRPTNRTRDESLAYRGEPWLVASDALVVGPVGYPAPAAALRAISGLSPSGAGGDRAGSAPAILFAIDERDLDAMAVSLHTDEVSFAVLFRAKNPSNAPAGYKRIAIAPLEIPAYELFSDLNWKGLVREITTRLVPADDATFRDAITAEQISEFYGRVLRRTKRRFESFTPDDFLPQGATSGVAAGIVGRAVAMTVRAEQVSGLGMFGDDDCVALIRAGDLRLPQNAVLHASTEFGPAARVVVQRARILRAAGDTSGTITLEVRQDDVAALQAALAASEDRLTAVALPREEQGRGDEDGGEPSLPVAVRQSAPPLAGIPDHSPVLAGSAFRTVVGRREQIHLFETPRKPLP